MISAAFRRLLAVGAIVSLTGALPALAAAQKELQAVRGEVGTQAAKDAPFARVFSKGIVGDDAFAVTHAGSNGLVLLEDSSQVALGPNTSVQLGRFNGIGATATTVTLDSGTMRFAVTHPAGQRSNYVFKTATSQIAVRGTIGLYSHDPATGDTIVCVQCEGDDAIVTVGNGTPLKLKTGDTVFISLLGLITTGAAAAAAAQVFGASGLSTSASQTAFAPGVGSGAGAGAAGAAAGPLGGVAGLAAAGAIAGAAIVTSTTAKKQTPTPAASSVPGGVSITAVRPTPSPSPTPAAKH